ncbi:MAG: hypothetical protein KA533_05315 [Sphingobium sp.]|nr:hypothetical protein [Sphingobium sp.]MBP6110800.1 hypothetical protein [Sphingobium sp.]MBP9157488.1 hypothetical protein [Sphingobium sp.]MCC6481601.1 hypothetical protein [Sphingomonadaceae bacterium]
MMQSTEGRTVTINRVYLMRSALFALLLLWPLLVFGRPAYMDDSASYQNGGEQAVGFVLRKLHFAEPQARIVPHAAKGKMTRHDTGAKKEEGGQSTKVARSIIYSALAYIFSGPGMTMMHLAVFHAATVALALVALFEGIAGPGWRPFAGMAALTAFASPIAPIVTFMMPDCYAPVMIGAMAILPFYWARFSGAIRVMILALAALGVAAHISHPPIALGLALAVSPFLILLRRKMPVSPYFALAILWTPVVMGIGLVALSGLVGFGKASIAPKHYPLALARAIDNGPARWYLVEACKDRARYAICEVYGTAIPYTVQETLWSKRSLIVLATPEQLDRVRSEENRILIETTKRYPLQQLYLVVHDVPDQFIAFKLNYFRYNAEIVRGSGGDIILHSPGETPQPTLYIWLEALNNLAVAAGVLALALSWRRMNAAQRGAILIMLIGLLANAAVCAIFSGVASRYQARIVWLVPWFMLAIGFAHCTTEQMTARKKGHQ